MHRKLLKWTAITIGSLIALVVVLLIAFQLAVSRAPEYRVQLQQWLSEKTQLSIEFSRLTARLRLYGPELAFDDVTVRSADRTRVLATARGGSVAFDLWNSLRSGRLTAGRFTLDSPQLGLIRTRDGRIQIAGQSSLAEQTEPFAVENLPIGKFRVRDALVSFQDEATKRAPWSLSGVDFMLVRHPELLELQGEASLPTTLGEKLEFSARVAGALEAPQSAVSTLTIDGTALDLTGWADLLPDRWPAPKSGRGALHVTASFTGPQLQSIIGTAQFTALTAATPVWNRALPTAAPLIPGRSDETDQPTNRDAAALAAAAVELPTPPASKSDVSSLLSYDRAAIEARVERKDGGWQARVTSLELDATEAAENKASDWQARDIEFAWSSPSDGSLKVSGKADVILLASVAPLFAYLPESDALARIRALNLRGTVRDLVFSASREAPESKLRYAVAASTDAIGFDPVAKVPGFTGISGNLKADERKGEFQLDSGPMFVSVPYMFRWPLDANAVRATLTWRDEDSAWSLGTEDLRFDAADGKGEARLLVRVPKDGSSPHLDISAQARNMNAAATPKYLPANTLSEQALAWLDRAFVSGRVPQGSLELHGPARSFPFRDGQGGEFLVKGTVEDLTFNYQEGWVPATALTGQVEFRNEGMQGNNITARVGELELTDVNGGIADFKQSEIKVSAVAAGDLNAALGFLQTSPIGEQLGNSFRALTGQGATQSTVSFLLPLKRVEDLRLSVATKLTDASVRLGDLNAPVTQLNGSLIVRQSLPVEADLNGQWLGGAFNVRVTPDDQTDRSATLVARGRATAEKLASFMPAAVRLSGALDWRLSTQLTSNSERRAQVFAIDSSMQGLGIVLPHPVGKDADMVRPLHVDLEQSKRQLLARASFGDLRALIRMQPTRDGWVFDRGSVRADAVAAALPDHEGLRVEGSVDRLRLDDWFALRESDTSQATASAERDGKLSDFLRAANLRVGVLQLYGYEWPEVRGMMQATDAGWRVDVTGANAEGQVVIPEDFAGAHPLTVDLERLIVQRSESAGDKTSLQTQRDPREWPSLRVHIGDMHLENHPIGGVEIVTTRVAEGMRIESLTIAQDAVQAEARGDWLRSAAGERSSLVAKVTSTDVRATLRALNYTEFLEAQKAEVSAQLSWPGGFDGNLVKRASGVITVSADEGQLLTLQPGAGRVLGLFSVAALPRRLSLDFSDLTEQGLSFDTIRGDFELREGNAYTDNLLLRGPAAEIGIAGRTGLGTQDFDQTAIVTGNLGASIPVAGAIAGGPALGAALLLFSQVFKEPLKGIARGYYRITGTWDEPVVERVDAAVAKEKAENDP